MASNETITQVVGILTAAVAGFLLFLGGIFWIVAVAVGNDCERNPQSNRCKGDTDTKRIGIGMTIAGVSVAVVGVATMLILHQYADLPVYGPALPRHLETIHVENWGNLPKARYGMVLHPLYGWMEPWAAKDRYDIDTVGFPDLRQDYIDTQRDGQKVIVTNHMDVNEKLYRHAKVFLEKDNSWSDWYRRPTDRAWSRELSKADTIPSTSGDDDYQDTFNYEGF